MTEVKWSTCNKGKKTPKRHCEQKMLECTLQLFTPDHMTMHAVPATMMKGTKLATVKKVLDEESIKLSSMAREQIQKTG